MMVKLLTCSLSAITVMGQVPDLREGDCVRALDNIEYEGDIPLVKKGDRGMVTGKGIAWEGRDWKFKKNASASEAEPQYLFRQRNAIIHRSMVEKMSETEGYGSIQLKDQNKCLTVFELEASPPGGKEQSPKVQWWGCDPGWADQMFIYPACGLGPGQIRWAKDPRQCLFRQPYAKKLVLSSCEWTQPFMFKIGQNYQGGQAGSMNGKLKVGAKNAHTDDEAANPPQCFTIADGELGGNMQCTFGDDDEETDCFAFSDAGANVACPELTFKGLWNAELLNV
jgi:hypothetical protein